MLIAFKTLPVKRRFGKIRRFSRIANYNKIPLKMPRVQAEGILNRPALRAAHSIFLFLC